MYYTLPFKKRYQAKVSHLCKEEKVTVPRPILAEPR